MHTPSSRQNRARESEIDSRPVSSSSSYYRVMHVAALSFCVSIQDKYRGLYIFEVDFEGFLLAEEGFCFNSNFNSKSRNLFKNFLDISLSLDRSRARFVPAFDSLFLSLCSNRWYPVAQFDRLILEHSAGSFMLVTRRVLKGQLFFTTATNSEKRDAMNDKKRSAGGRRATGEKKKGRGGEKWKRANEFLKFVFLRELRIEHSVSYAW